MPGEGMLLVGLYAARAVLGIALGLTLWRLLRGPTIPDRVVALDLIALQAVAIIAVQTCISGQVSLLITGIVIGLLGFLTTVALARYLERRARE